MHHFVVGELSKLVPDQDPLQFSFHSALRDQASIPSGSCGVDKCTPPRSWLSFSLTTWHVSSALDFSSVLLSLYLGSSGFNSPALHPHGGLWANHLRTNLGSFPAQTAPPPLVLCLMWPVYIWTSLSYIFLKNSVTLLQICSSLSSPLIDPSTVEVSPPDPYRVPPRRELVP